MPRVKVVVDKHAFQVEIDRIERSGPLKNRSHLFKAVAEGTWGKNNGITVAVATARFLEFGLTAKSPVGRLTEVAKARDAGTAPTARHTAPEPEEGLEDEEPAEPVTREPKAAPKPVKMGKVDFEEFFEPFTRRGLKPECLEDLVSSTSKTDAENIAIWSAWYEVTQRVVGRTPSKEHLIKMWENEGLEVPKRVLRLVERANNGQEIPKKSDTVLYPRVEMVR